MPATTYKVVWSNGDEVYVSAANKAGALSRARSIHGPTTARVIYCAPYA